MIRGYLDRMMRQRAELPVDADLTTIGRELLERLDLRILEQILSDTEGANMRALRPGVTLGGDGQIVKIPR